MANFDPEQSGDVEVSAPPPPTLSTTLEHAAQAAGETALGFIPRSLSQILGFTTPAMGGFEDIAKAGRTIRDVASGVPIQEAIEKNIPESQVLKRAEQTAPFSRERFAAGFQTVAPLGLFAAAPLGEALFPKAKPTFDPVQVGDVPVANAVFSTTEGVVPTASGEDMRSVVQEPLIQETTPAEEVTNASQITSPTGAISGEVRPSVDEETPLRQSGETPEVRPQAQEVPQEVGQRADVMALAEQEGLHGVQLESQVQNVNPLGLVAAAKEPSGQVIAGKDIFHGSLAASDVSEPGWMDQQGNFLTRVEAAKATSDARRNLAEGKPATAPIAARPSKPVSITSIRNEQVDAERAARNLPPVVEPARKAFGVSWDEASKKIDENPNYPDQLVEELKSKPRALTDVEDATLLHRQVDLQNQYQKGAAALFKATEVGDEVGRLEASARVNALSDQLSELYDVGKKAGTETGRGLAARKLLAAEDFSLANMVTQKRAALQGAQLSDEQVAQVNTAKNKVSAAQIALDAYETSPKAEGYRKRLATLAEEYRARTAAGDFAPRERARIPLDKDLERRQADLARAKKDWYTELAKDQAKNRTASQKFWDRFVGVERAMKLSSDVVLAKLTAAAAVREGVLTPVEEAVGGGISKVLPGLAKRAPREGGFSLDAEIKAKAAMFTDGMKDAWQNLKMKQTNLDELYKTGRIKAPDEFYDYLGYLHGALKAPVKRAEFTRSLIKQMKWATENGQDLNNVNTMRAISEEAYVDANRSIFLQDNIVSDVFTGALRMSEQSKKAPNLGPAVARIGRFLVPIVKVPTNIVGEVATGVHGVATGGTRAAAAYIKGIGSLPTAQGDSIMRQLKKGAVGNSLLLAGYFGYKNIGGFYHDQDKRTAEDVQAGRYRVGNVDIPASAGHSTGAMLLNIGATVHRVQDELIKKTEPETKGFGAGVLAAGQGLAKEVPFVPAVTGIADALGTKNGFEKYIMNMIASTTTPALVTHVAKVIDTPGTFPENILHPPTPRKPTNPIEAFETTIPGLRERVKERALKGSTTSTGGDYIR